MKSEISSSNTHVTANIPRRKIEWRLKELAAWKPPEQLTVSEWADKNRIMDPKTSAFPGKWKTDRTPYLRGVMDAYNDNEIEKIVFCCASQVGKSETLLNILGYIIDQDPDSVLIVYPTLDLAEFTSENRIEPMIQAAPTLSEKYNKRESQKLELQFQNMYIALSGANSPASLASRPIRYVFLDEVDKYPDFSGKEADPISLAIERTKTFYNRKIFMCSTPTIELGPIWKAYEEADAKKEFYVPCPHCGYFQTFKMKQIKWPKDMSEPDVVRDVAWYECEKCVQVIEDRYKPEMLRGGEWRTEKQVTGRARSIGFHLSSIYSPWLTFGDIAAEFLRSKEFPEKLRNFINSWLGEPWRDKASTLKSDAVLEKQWKHERGMVPDGAVFLTAGVDVQMDHFWWEVRAWGESITSWLVDYGRCETWDEIERILVRTRYKGPAGREFIVALACVDSGYRTDEVYEFCTTYSEVARPVKGSSSRMTAPYSVSKIDKSKFQGLKLWVVDTHYFKDFIIGRLQKSPGSPGAWMVFRDCPREYAEHITSEQKVTRQNRHTGKITEEWVPVSSHAQNHLLDTAVYSAAAAEILGVRHLQSLMSQPRKQRKVYSTGVSM